MEVLSRSYISCHEWFGLRVFESIYFAMARACNTLKRFTAFDVQWISFNAARPKVDKYTNQNHISCEKCIACSGAIAMFLSVAKSWWNFTSHSCCSKRFSPKMKCDYVIDIVFDYVHCVGVQNIQHNVCWAHFRFYSVSNILRCVIENSPQIKLIHKEIWAFRRKLNAI